jgi:peroxiredoxin
MPRILATGSKNGRALPGAAQGWTQCAMDDEFFMPRPQFETLEDAFAYCRDLDASLTERLRLFSEISRDLRPEGQELVDRLADRLAGFQACAAAPAPGDLMPAFALPDETGRIVGLDDLLQSGPAAITFHRGHWCPYCRINTRALAEVQDRIVSEGASIVAITPEREAYSARLKSDSGIRYPVLSDVDNGYALSIGLGVRTIHWSCDFRERRCRRGNSAQGSS